MRIGLNLLPVVPDTGGGWYYISNLLGALARFDTENSYFVFVTRHSESLVPAQDNFHAVHIGVDSVFRFKRILFENTLFHARAHSLRLDCVHWFANTLPIGNLVPSVVSVYDLLVFADDHPFSIVKQYCLQSMIKHTVSVAPVLLPISFATAAELTRLFGVSDDRMVVIPPALGPEFQSSEQCKIDKFRRTYNLPEQFWVYVGHAYPHKNHSRLLKAYRILKSDKGNVWPLVLRCDSYEKDDTIAALIKQLALERDVIRLPRLRNEEMPELYSAASALIFPSLFEGAGIPVVEAMACGCPVMASRIPAVTESAGNVALYFDPFDIEGIASGMLRLQGDVELRNALSNAGLKRARTFAPDEVVKNLLSAYRRASRVGDRRGDN